MSENKKPIFLLATVIAVEPEGLQLLLDGEEEAGEKLYKCANNVLFKVGDRVKLTEDSGTFMVDYALGLPMERVLIPEGGTDGQVLAKDGSDAFTLKWVNAGGGIPTGGSSGQVLAKASASNYDLKWITPDKNHIPTGGSTGQVLMKSSYTDYALKWGDMTVTAKTDKLENSLYYIQLSGTTLKPESPSIDLGSNAYPFGDIYTSGNAKFGLNAYSTLGFFGSSGATKQTVASSATVSTLITALKAYGLIG